jgi:hypothetical protein
MASSLVVLKFEAPDGADKGLELAGQVTTGSSMTFVGISNLQAPTLVRFS